MFKLMKRPSILYLASFIFILLLSHPQWQVLAVGLTIEPIPDVNMIEGDTTVVTVTVNNIADGGVLTVTVTDTLPDFVSFDGTSQFNLDPQIGDSGNYTITVEADDTTETTQESFNIAVAQIPPTATHTPTNTPTPTATVTATPTATLTPTPEPLRVTGSEPLNMVSGSETNLTIYGNHFTENTTVRLVGYGLVAVSYINDTSLLVTTPHNLPVATYTIQVSDPIHGSANSPNTLVVRAAPLPTRAPTITPIPPTPRPGLPELIVSSYVASPQRVQRESSTTFTITLVNQGSRTAQSINAAIDPSSSFVASSQQANVLLPDIPPGTSYTFSMTATASSNAESGINSIPITLSYRDFEERPYTTSAVLTAIIEEEAVEVSQLTLTGYSVDPDPLQPGQSVTVTVFITNTGNDTAEQSLLTVPVASGVLLAGSQGNAFPFGDVAPGVTIGLELPLIVSSEASAGVQSQTLNLSYLQGTTTTTTDTFMTVTVDTPRTSSLLLDSYSIGKERVQPGESFTLTATILNIGDTAVEEALVSFQSSTTANDTTTTSITFAPIGGGGTQVIETIAADDEGITFTQDFIVNGTVTSDIYDLPITVTFLNSDGTSGEANLSASVVVSVPPRLRFIEENPIPDTIRVNGAVELALSVVNIGRREAQLLEAHLLADNGEVVTDATILMQTLRVNEEFPLEGTIIPLDEGTMTITIEILFINDLNQEETITQEYTVEVLPTPTPMPTQPPRTPQPSITTFNTTPEPESFALPDNWVERMLLGLLGLGS